MSDTGANPSGLGNAVAVVLMAALACGASLLLANSTIVHPDKPTADAKAPAELASSSGSTAATPVSSKSDSAASTVLSAKPTSSTPLDVKITTTKPELNATMRPMLDEKVTVASATSPVKTPAATSPKSDTKPAESKQKEYLPVGPDLPTEVTIQSSGNSTAPIQRVEYSISAPFKSPARQSGKAKAGGIPVTFGESNFDGKAEKFSLSLGTPQVALVPNQPIPLAVQIVWPKYAGWSYRGKLIAYQAGQQPVTLENVEVDIVKTAAK